MLGRLGYTAAPGGWYGLSGLGIEEGPIEVGRSEYIEMLESGADMDNVTSPGLEIIGAIDSVPRVEQDPWQALKETIMSPFASINSNTVTTATGQGVTYTGNVPDSSTETKVGLSPTIKKVLLWGGVAVAGLLAYKAFAPKRTVVDDIIDILPLGLRKKAKAKYKGARKKVGSMHKKARKGVRKAKREKQKWEAAARESELVGERIRRALA